MEMEGTLSIYHSHIGVKAANQPVNDTEVKFQVMLKDGELDGSTLTIVGSLYPDMRNDGGRQNDGNAVTGSGLAIKYE